MSILRRKGQMIISVELILTEPKAAMRALDNSIVVRAEQDYMTNAIHYNLLHPEFRELNEGEVVPTYEVTINHNDLSGEYEVKFNEQEYP